MIDIILPYDPEESHLSEEDRLKLIDCVIADKEEIENSHPMMGGFVDYLLSYHMNKECLKCALSKRNGGKCYGKLGTVPCLIFRKV